MNKTFNTLEVLNIVGFNNQLTEEKNAAMGIKVRWALKNALKTLISDAQQFEEFREAELQKIRDEFFNDEKSEEVSRPQLDDNGNPVLDEEGNEVQETVRQIKKEFIDDYQITISKLQQELDDILKEKHEYEYKGVDINALVETLPDDTALTFEDVNMLDLILGE